jgi:hypothetical protein
MRIILVRGQNFASGVEFLPGVKILLVGVKFLLVGVKILLLGVKFLLIWGKIRNLKKINFFSKKLFFKFNYFSPFFFNFYYLWYVNLTS